jgi:hypothetical protein
MIKITQNNKTKWKINNKMMVKKTIKQRKSQQLYSWVTKSQPTRKLPKRERQLRTSDVRSIKSWFNRPERKHRKRKMTHESQAKRRSGLGLINLGKRKLLRRKSKSCWVIT